MERKPMKKEFKWLMRYLRDAALEWWLLLSVVLPIVTLCILVMDASMNGISYDMATYLTPFIMMTGACGPLLILRIRELRQSFKGR